MSRDTYFFGPRSGDEPELYAKLALDYSCGNWDGRYMRFFVVHPSRALPLDWRKSSFSWANGDCVEVASRSGGLVRVRDSRDASGAMLAFDRSQWNAFVGALRDDVDDCQ